MELGEPDASGRRRPVPIKGSEFDMELDMIIPAIGQATELSFLGENSGIETTKRGTLAADTETLATSRPGVFAGGDAVSGPAMAIEAVAAGKRAAAYIDNYLRGE
jgi:NADPH-dependent glutamate synthase beta subunit-like oxidoreductase